MAEQADEAIGHVYDAVARLINCSHEEIALIENATREVSQKTGAVVEVIPNDAYGQISLKARRKAIDERVKLIAITHVPTNGGLVTRRGATLLDMDARGLESMVRASVHYYNSEEEVERFCQAVETLL